MMSKHTMKRDGFGGYTYRGYTIERMLDFDDRQQGWKIGNSSGEIFDAFLTLATCRRMIDAWLA